MKLITATPVKKEENQIEELELDEMASDLLKDYDTEEDYQSETEGEEEKKDGD
jgi:hypothetical protein